MREALIVSALESAAQAEEIGPAGRSHHPVVQGLGGAGPDRASTASLAARCDYPLHLGLTEAGMGSKGIVASTAAMGVLLQEGIGDTIRVSLTPEPGGDRTREVIVAQEILQTMGLRSFTPHGLGLPRLRAHHEHLLPGARRQDPDATCARRCRCGARSIPGVEDMHVAVMGCVVNGPGESKLANIGISLPGSGEKPVAPVFVDGEKTVTLKGERIAEEFQAIVEDYVRTRYARRRRGARHAAQEDHRDPGGRQHEHEREDPGASAAWRTSCPTPRPCGRSSRTRAARSSASTATATSARPSSSPRRSSCAASGEVTDIVEKEMYTFDDRNGESLTLRPEATAGIVRAAIEHNFLYNGPMRVWTAGPMFRYERPQKGRQRQFHQYDVEALGFEGPDVDAEQIVMLARLWKTLGLGRHRAARELHRRRGRPPGAPREAGRVLREARRRSSTRTRSGACTPTRCASSTRKNPAMQAMIEGAPQLLDHLGDGGGAALRGAAAAARGRRASTYAVNPRLVRGLDYYNRTVFEWVTDRIGAQSTIAGRRALRRPLRAAGRQAHARLRLRHGHGARAAHDAGLRARAPRQEPDAFVVHAGEAAAREAWRLARAPARRGARRACSAPAAASSRR